MKQESRTQNKKNFASLLADLKRASDEIWEAKYALTDVSRKHAALCVKVLETIKIIPKLPGQLIQNRSRETDGRDIDSEDFWSSPDLIIALQEYMERSFDFVEDFGVLFTGEEDERRQTW